MKKFILCIPNVSAGRDPALVEQIVDQVRQVVSVKLLDYSSDADHNRSVLTYLGEPEPVLDATKRMATKAIELIDMSLHHGSHPRIGAVDVVPFVPVRGIETAEVVEVAREFGRYLGSMGVPVYYYESAATQPDRESLPKIRKGEYEGLEEKLKDPAWKPDEGPAEFNARTGATVTGARPPLIAFNVNLRTTDLSIADRIAKAIRHINGGYRYVRAMAVPLEEQGLVQVSINLVNYEKTPIPRVLETIRFEAASHGVAIAGTELIGAVPLGAVEDIMKHYLQLHDFSIGQIVETALID
jgi:glutamate formiminotransferase